MKKITRLADSVLERLVSSAKASAGMQPTAWTECRFNVFCAVTGRREKMSCRVAGSNVVVCDSIGCGC